MNTQQIFKKTTSLPGLLKTTRETLQTYLNKIGCKDDKSKISTLDCLMSAVAMFSMKCASLLEFDQTSRDVHVKHNLNTLYKVSRAPSDTQMRERLDPIDSNCVRKAFTEIFASIQRSKGLQPYLYHNDRYLISLDGTGYFSSPTVHCEHCCIKNHKNGTKTYFHQALAAVMIHPEKSTVIPFCPEPIIKSDGDNKNDCEANAVKRLISDIRREHPHLKFIAVQDALSANGPHINFLQENDVSFIIGVTEKGCKNLFLSLKNLNLQSVTTQSEKDNRIKIELSFYNDISINDSHKDVKVNFLKCVESVEKKGKIVSVTTFTWVTDLELTKDNVYKIMRGARARWKVENETFNTLKNQGYNIEHNYGHGKLNLSATLMRLMFLVFLIDQTQERMCSVFQAALNKVSQRIRLWGKLRGLFTGYFITDWLTFFNSIIYGHVPHKLQVESG